MTQHTHLKHVFTNPHVASALVCVCTVTLLLSCNSSRADSCDQGSQSTHDSVQVRFADASLSELIRYYETLGGVSVSDLTSSHDTFTLLLQNESRVAQLLAIEALLAQHHLTLVPNGPRKLTVVYLDATRSDDSSRAPVSEQPVNQPPAWGFYVQRITDDAVQCLPSWNPANEACPLERETAISTARTAFEALLPATLALTLEDVAIVRITGNKWLYRIQFAVTAKGTHVAQTLVRYGQPFRPVSVAVAMNGWVPPISRVEERGTTTGGDPGTDRRSGTNSSMWSYFVTVPPFQ